MPSVFLGELCTINLNNSILYTTGAVRISDKKYGAVRFSVINSTSYFVVYIISLLIINKNKFLKFKNI